MKLSEGERYQVLVSFDRQTVDYLIFVPSQRLQALSSRRIPNLGRLVNAGSGAYLLVGVEGPRRQFSCVPRQRMHTSAGSDVPNFGRVIK